MDARVGCRICGWRRARIGGLCFAHDAELADLKDLAMQVMLSEIIWEPYRGELPRVDVG